MHACFPQRGERQGAVLEAEMEPHDATTVRLQPRTESKGTNPEPDKGFRLTHSHKAGMAMRIRACYDKGFKVSGSGRVEAGGGRGWGRGSEGGVGKGGGAVGGRGWGKGGWGRGLWEGVGKGGWGRGLGQWVGEDPSRAHAEPAGSLLRRFTGSGALDRRRSLAHAEPATSLTKSPKLRQGQLSFQFKDSRGWLTKNRLRSPRILFQGLQRLAHEEPPPKSKKKAGKCRALTGQPIGGGSTGCLG